MRQKIFKDKYPIYEFIAERDETTFKSVDEIIEYLKGKIEDHPVTAYIAIFDHYLHTSSLGDGTINENIKDAKNIVFCFGKELPVPEVMAVRPRSIGVTDMDDKFVIVFMEAPNPQANETMINWVKSIKNI